MLLSNQKLNLLKEKLSTEFKSLFDKKMISVLNALEYDSLDTMFETVSIKQKTVEKTKFLNYIYPNIIKKILKESNMDIHDYEGSGYDFTIDGYRIEAKLSLKMNGFTGNKYSSKSRSDYFILIKLELDEKSMLNGIYVSIYDPSKSIESKWKSSSSTKTAFSNLEFYKSDVNECLQIIIGDLDYGTERSRKIKKEILFKY